MDLDVSMSDCRLFMKISNWQECCGVRDYQHRTWSHPCVGPNNQGNSLAESRYNETLSCCLFCSKPNPRGLGSFICKIKGAGSKNISHGVQCFVKVANFVWCGFSVQSGLCQLLILSVGQMKEWENWCWDCLQCIKAMLLLHCSCQRHGC